MSSFRLVADQYILHMRLMGIQIDEFSLNFEKRRDRPSSGWAPLAIVHPLFLFRDWGNVSFHEVMECLSSRHQIIMGIEVADSDRISARFAKWANHSRLAGIVLPSRFSSLAYLGSGVVTPLSIVPHGIMTAAASERFSFLGGQGRPVILFFARHSPYRKGWDIVREILPRFSDCIFVVKTNGDGEDYFRQFRNVMILTEWLSPSDLASLYTFSSLLISPHRGGAFELNCAEALGYGLPVVATRHGCVLDYLNDSNSWLIEASHSLREGFHGDEHCGSMASPAIDNACARIHEVLAKPAAAYRRSSSGMMNARRELSWQRATEKLIVALHGLTS